MQTQTHWQPQPRLPELLARFAKLQEAAEQGKGQFEVNPFVYLHAFAELLPQAYRAPSLKPAILSNLARLLDTTSAAIFTHADKDFKTYHSY